MWAYLQNGAHPLHHEYERDANRAHNHDDHLHEDTRFSLRPRRFRHRLDKILIDDAGDRVQSCRHWAVLQSSHRFLPMCWTYLRAALKTPATNNPGSPGRFVAIWVTKNGSTWSDFDTSWILSEIGLYTEIISVSNRSPLWSRGHNRGMLRKWRGPCSTTWTLCSKFQALVS